MHSSGGGVTCWSSIECVCDHVLSLIYSIYSNNFLSIFVDKSYVNVSIATYIRSHNFMSIQKFYDSAIFNLNNYFSFQLGKKLILFHDISKKLIVLNITSKLCLLRYK